MHDFYVKPTGGVFFILLAASKEGEKKRMKEVCIMTKFHCSELDEECYLQLA